MHTTPLTHSIGCDVSKQTLDLAVMAENQRVTLSFAVRNDATGHKEILQKLKPFRTASRIIIESTSHYHLALALALSRAAFSVCVINPIITKKFASAGIRKTKTDRTDAKLLARIGLLEPHLNTYQDTPEIIEKKLLSQLITAFKRERSAMKQRLRRLKEMEEICLTNDPAPLDIVREMLEAYDTRIHTLERRLLALVDEEAHLVATIKGVGAGSAACIVAELGDISRFRDRDQVTAFAGLDPSVCESGSSIHRRGRVTKRGSSELRCALGQAAWGVMMHNPKFQDYYAKKKREGKHYLTILVAVAKKLLLIIYSMLKSKTPYDPSRYTQVGDLKSV